MTSSKRIAGTAGGAVGLTGFAALLGTCCVAPWAVTLFGMSGALLLARLAFLQPYLLIMAIATLGLAFWWAYRRPRSSPEGTCDALSTRRARRWVWLAAGVMAVLAAIAVMPMFGI